MYYRNAYLFSLLFTLLRTYQVGSVVKERLTQIIEIIKDTPGLRSNAIAGNLNVNEQTIRKDIQRLQELKLILFKGTPKTGGCFISEELLEKLDE